MGWDGMGWKKFRYRMKREKRKEGNNEEKGLNIEYTNNILE